MYCVVEDNDRFVVKYVTSDDKILGVLATDEVAYGEVYYTIWEREENFQIMWRGSLDSCLKEFTDIAGDLETERIAEENRVRQEELRKVVDKAGLSATEL